MPSDDVCHEDDPDCFFSHQRRMGNSDDIADLMARDLKQHMTAAAYSSLADREYVVDHEGDKEMP